MGKTRGSTGEERCSELYDLGKINLWFGDQSMFSPGPARWWSVVAQNSWRLEHDPFKFTYNPWQMTTVIIAVVLVASLVVATGVLFNVKPVNSASSSRELYGWSSYPAGGHENVNMLQFERCS